LRSHVVQTFPSGAAAANGSTIRIGHALDTAQRDAIGFHHRGQHLLAGVDAQAQERMAHVAQYTLHGHRELNLRAAWLRPGVPALSSASASQRRLFLCPKLTLGGEVGRGVPAFQTGRGLSL
jgi:hypothetical protein